MAEDRIAGDFGSRLRAARERKGISLRQIANATKISVAVLEGLERNDLSRLPGGIFSRAFVRSYAAAVGLDPEATVHDFVAEFPHESVTAGHVTGQQVEDTEGFESDRRMAGTLLWILLVSVPIAGGVLYFETLDRNSTEGPEVVAVNPSPPEVKPRPGAGSEPAPSSASSSAPSVEKPVAAVAPPVGAPPRAEKSQPQPAGAAAASGAAADLPAVEAAGGVTSAPVPGPASPGLPQPPAGAAAASGSSVGAASANSLSAAPAGDHLTVGLAIHRPVWVSATVDGQKRIERLLQPGELQTVEVRREMVFTAGDASAISMTLNGEDARALGKAGEVVTTRLNLTNFRDYLQAR